MRRTIQLFLIFFIGSLLSAQDYCLPGRFDTARIFTYPELHHRFNGIYGTATDWLGQPDTLTYDLFMPHTAIDTFSHLPFVMWIHGGGFWTGDKAVMDYPAIVMAQRGYVSASINYRVGWDIGTGPSHCDGNYGQQVMAMYRALQDAHAAMRYFVHFADSFHIDTNYLFIGGSSAGAVISLLMAYAQQVELDTLIDTIDLHGLLGPLDSSGNVFTESFRIRGVISLWGGLPDTTLITGQDQVPLMMMHGTNDQIVPYVFGAAYNCPNAPELYGSLPMQQRMESLNGCYELDYLPGGGHGVFPVDYRLEREGLFLKRILCDDCRQIIMEDTIYIQNDSAEVTGLTMKPVQELSGFRFYPNPAANHLVLETVQDPAAVIRLRDLSGRLVAAWEKPAGTRTLTIDLSGLKPGIYLLSVDTGYGKQIRKMVVL